VQVVDLLDGKHDEVNPTTSRSWAVAAASAGVQSRSSTFTRAYPLAATEGVFAYSRTSPDGNPATAVMTL